MWERVGCMQVFFGESWGLPSLLWTIICPHFRVLGFDFLVLSRLRFHIWGRNPVFQKPDSCGERTLATRSKDRRIITMLENVELC